MQIVQISQQPPTSEELAALYLQAGWMKTADPEKMTRATESSSEWFVARAEGGQLLGFGRFITDYARYAFVIDVIVDKSQRGKGIGTALMNMIIDSCREAGIDSVNLWPSKGNAPFYERLVFYALPKDQPHMKLKR